MPVPAPVTMATLAGPAPPVSSSASDPPLLAVIGCEHDGWFSVRADVTARHAARVERHRDVAVCVEANDAAFTADRLQRVLDERVRRSLDQHVPVLHPRTDLVC